MKLHYCLILLVLASCQSETNQAVTANGEAFKLKPMRQIASEYRYEVINETNLETEVDGKEVENSSNSIVGVRYKITTDSQQNVLVQIAYDKITVHSKNAGVETELNADNAAFSANPAEKILGYLKESTLVAVLDKKGQTKEVRGYKKLGEKIIAGFDPADTYGKTIAQKQWNEMLRQQMVDDNLKQVFGIFPDSLVRIGEQWKTTTRSKDQFNLVVDNVYTLKTVKDSLATVQLAGKIRSENGTVISSGFGTTTANLSGNQQGQYKVDLRTGMPTEVEIKSTIDGNMQAMGREVPVSLSSKVKIKKR